MHGTARNLAFTFLVALVVCTVTLTVTGCGGRKQTKEQVIARYSHELRGVVSAKVGDEQRRAQMLLIVDQLEAVHRRFSQQTADFIESYRKLNADYDATRPAFNQLLSDYTAKRIGARKEALDLHFQLASLATVDEWDAIGRAEIELYDEVKDARLTEDSE